MILEEVFPNSGNRHPVSRKNLAGLASLYPKVLGFRLNYVISTQTQETNSDSISNPLDRLILKFIRSQSDVIITSGQTARQEVLRSSIHAPMLILTGSTDDFDIPAVTEQSINSVYLTQRLGTIYPNSKAVAIGRFQGLATAFARSFCQSNAFKAVVLETGLTLSREFAEANQIGEIDLTVTSAESQEKALARADSFLTSIGIHRYSAIQILRLDDSWFFRFENLSTSSQ
jgi:hypothetical protein